MTAQSGCRIRRLTRQRVQNPARGACGFCFRGTDDQVLDVVPGHPPGHRLAGIESVPPACLGHRLVDRRLAGTSLG